MLNNNIGVFHLVEAFTVGLSCLVGGDQFYIFISRTKASIESQYYMVIVVIIVTFVGSMAITENIRALFDSALLAYFLLLTFSVIILLQNVKSTGIITVYNILLGVVLTFLIIQGCANYSKSKSLLFSFLIGLFAARLIPDFCWSLMKKKNDSESQMNSLAINVTIGRVLICFLSLVMKVLLGTMNLKFKIKTKLMEDAKNIYFIKYSAIFWNLMKKVRISIIPFFCFIVSMAIYIAYPPSMFKSYFTYSPNLTSSLSTVEMVFHLLGSYLGIAFPASISSDDMLFYVVTGIVFFLYIYCQVTEDLIDRFSHNFFYILVILSSTFLGYYWIYTLGIVYDTTLGKTCVYVDARRNPCCGSKFSRECYCRYPKIIEYYVSKVKPDILNRYSCSSLYATYSLDYDPSAKKAVLILFNLSPNDINKIHNSGGGNSNCQNNNCLELVGMYKLNSITTSTCNNCQLTIRLEGTSKYYTVGRSSCGTTCCTTSCGSSCCNSGGGICCCCCSCRTDRNTCCNKCLLCLKCCSLCKGQCTYVKFFFCNKLGCNCNCNNDKKKARVFIAYKISSKNFIREIKPNHNSDFLAELTKQNEFDIRKIYISDCCHTDLVVDLHCSMKNNFFRLTPIDYPKKTVKPFSIELSKNGSECCTSTSSNTCCCTNTPLSKVSVSYSPPSDEDKKKKKGCKCKATCTSRCGCCNGQPQNCCCCSVCEINVSETDSFHTRIDPMRVQIICLTMFYIAFVTMFIVLIVYWIRSKDVPPYIFDPNTTYDNLKKVISKRNLNTFQTMAIRIQYLTEKVKNVNFNQEDVDNMFSLFRKVMDGKSFKSLKKYVASSSNQFISRSVMAVDKKRLDVIRWCYCTGIVYAYFISVLESIQRFFSHWEKAWQSEYFDYRKLLNSVINKKSHTSKFAISLMSEIDVSEVSVYLIRRDRTKTWNNIFDELGRYADLYDNEVKFCDDFLPHRIDNRMKAYLNRWNHRLSYINDWIQDQRSLYDWRPFLYYFDEYKTWYHDFKMYLFGFSNNVKLPDKVMKKGTAVFYNYKIK